MTTASPNSVLSEVQNRDRLRDQFETAWDGPARPKIEDYLGGVVELERPALLRELLGLELELRRESGEQPGCHEYELRFPEYVALVQAVFREGALPPERIDRYQVRRRLGGGGFGEVYLC